MAKYTSDTNLIKGAETAYRDYDNVAGMYAGLDKVTQAGVGIMKQGIKLREEERIRAEQAQEAIKKKEAKKAKSRKEYNTLKEKVLEKFDGSPVTTVYQDHIRKELELLRLDQIKANKTNDQDLMSSVKGKFSNISQRVTGYKESRANLAGISKAVSGEELEILTAWGNEKKTVEKKDGEEYFVIDVGGNKFRKTQEQLNDMMTPKDVVTQSKFSKIFKQYDKAARKPNDASLMYDIQQTVLPQTPDGLHAYLSDPVFGMKKTTFSQQMLTPKNKEGFTKYLKSKGVELSDYDTNNDANDDYREFVDAIANPGNKHWKGDKEAWFEKSSEITAEILANLTKNTLGNDDEGKRASKFNK